MFKAKQLIFFMLVPLFIVACSNKTNKNAEPQINKSDKVETKEFKTKSGKVFVVYFDYSMGASICELKIETRDFTAANNTYKIGSIDRVEEIFLADLDANGFEEIYVITRSSGSGSYSNIYGLASNKDKSASLIYVPPISETQKKPGGIFDGFMGHNSFKLEGGKLINTFPVYKNADTNAKPSGGTKSLKYELVAGEATWILQVKNHTEV